MKFDLKRLRSIFVRVIYDPLVMIARNRSALIGFIILLMFVVMATFGPALIELDTAAHPERIYQPPSWGHLLGTDYAGRDVLAQIVHGSRTILLICFFTVLISMSAGVTIGMVSGFFGGIVDTLLMRIADFFLTIPSLPLMIVLAAYVRVDSAPTMALILSITAWAGFSRAIRAQVLSLKEREFIEAAKVLGLRKNHIIFRELLPNMGSYIATNAILAFTGAMYAQVGLFFLGVVPFSSLNWGVMLNFAVSQGGALYTLRSVHYLLAPIVCIVLLQIGAVLFARAMEILFNPRLKV